MAERLMFPIAMELGPDGAFCVSTPAIGANDGSGAIVRIATGDTTATSKTSESATVILDEPGTHQNLCTYHLNTIGTITVT